MLPLSYTRRAHISLSFSLSFLPLYAVRCSTSTTRTRPLRTFEHIVGCFTRCLLVVYQYQSGRKYYRERRNMYNPTKRSLNFRSQWYSSLKNGAVLLSHAKKINSLCLKFFALFNHDVRTHAPSSREVVHLFFSEPFSEPPHLRRSIPHPKTDLWRKLKFSPHELSHHGLLLLFVHISYDVYFEVYSYCRYTTKNVWGEKKHEIPTILG